MTITAPIIINDTVDVHRLPRRSFDPAKGDRRFLDQERAIKHAEEEAVRTGVRQTVRPDSEVPGASGARFYLVQAVGS
jgi:hypothetical protein